jgi:hypothetical protein
MPTREEIDSALFISDTKYGQYGSAGSHTTVASIAAEKPKVPMAMLTDVYYAWVRNTSAEVVADSIKMIAARHNVEVE